METPTTPKKDRPQVQRSHTASANLSPGSKGTQHNTKRLNHLLHYSHGHHVKQKHSADELHRPPSTSILHQVNPLAEIGKITGRSAGHKAKSSVPNDIHRQGLNDFNESATLKPLPKPVTSQELEREKERSELREEELHSSLNSLSEFAHATTRRLDGMFYSILDKAGTLHDTIRSLQELSAASSNLRKEFEQDVKSVEEKVERQISLFGEFEDQQSKIDNLELRVQTSRDRAKELDKRLEASRSRLERWEEREKEWQAKTSRRIRMGWSCTLVVGLVLTILIVFRGPIISVLGGDHSSIDSQRIRLSPDDITRMFFNDTGIRRLTSPKQDSSPLPQDTRLDLFDEL